jgi:hypothetical protein
VNRYVFTPTIVTYYVITKRFYPMKIKKAHYNLIVTVAVIAAIALSACNRKSYYGCPVSFDVKPFLDVLGC